MAGAADADGGTKAVRATVRGRVQGVGFREAAAREARRLGALGWVRNEPDGTLRAHVEGAEAAVDGMAGFLGAGPPGAAVEDVALERAEVEGHEQFAVRGVGAGRFLVQEHHARGRHFDLRLEVGGAMRSWAVPKGPSMDPAVKRLAIEVADHESGETPPPGASVWDEGTYEQGGRVPWPEAIERGHAVFVLRGRRLRGGFALQRTGRGERPRWLLVKRRDDEALPGSDVVAEAGE